MEQNKPPRRAAVPTPPHPPPPFETRPLVIHLPRGTRGDATWLCSPRRPEIAAPNSPREPLDASQFPDVHKAITMYPAEYDPDPDFTTGW